MRTNVLRLMFTAMLVALAWGRVAPAYAHSDVLDFSTCGTPNDPAADNTAALIDALEDRTSTNEKMVIYFPAGDWYFSGTLPVNSHTDLSIFDNVTIIGAPSAHSAQHLEEGNSNVEKRRTRFIIDMANETDTWWGQVRNYRFGPLAFHDVTFQVKDVGRVFSFGDVTDTSTAGAELRGLSFLRCYFTHLRSFNGADVGGGHAWMYDADPTGGVNYVLNKTNQSFSIRMHKCYDVTIRDCAFRGARYGVINAHGDRVVMSNIRGFLVGKLIEEYSLPGNAAVGSQIDDVFAEIPILAGAVITGQAGKVRTESGYNLPAPIGPYSLPSDIEWNIAVNGSTVDFTFPGGWGYDCTDYFEPRSVIRVRPEQSGEPERFLYITSVSANSITFARSTSLCHVNRAIGGDGADVTRFFGTGCIVDGDRASLMQPSLGINEDKDDLPIAFIVPNLRPIRFGANIETSGPDPDDPTNLPVVVASCAGTQWTLNSGVDWLGSSDPPNHPLVNLGGVGPKYDPNVREPIFDPFSRKQLFVPGRGVGTQNNCSKHLTFHKVNDSEIGQDVWCYRLSDSTAGWQIRTLRKPDRAANYTLRAYVPTGTPTLNVKAGGTWNTHSLSAGWQTISGSLTDAQVTSDYIQFDGAGIYLAWVQADQN